MSELSPFHEVHVKAGAVLREVEGWLMPEHYGDPAGERRAAGETLAVFDRSFCSRVRLEGKEAGRLLERLAGEDLGLAEGGQKLVSFNGAPDARALVQRQDDSWVVIGAPGGREKLLAQLEAHRAGLKAKISDETFSTAMVALRGPKALPLLKDKLPFDLSELPAGGLIIESFFFMRFVIAELIDGCGPGALITLPAKTAGMAWDMLVKYGRPYGAVMAGTAAWQAL